MSTIASPRPSVTLSSRRGSTSTDTTITSTTRPPSQQLTTDRGSLRRNRAALRDYYNLAAAANDSTVSLSTVTSAEDDLPSTSAIPTALDNPTFNAESHVATLLATSPLPQILRAEHDLQSAIRSLDGERKALVYDNYAKLITATDTIRRMRDRMDPVTPAATTTLTPAVAHIAERAGVLRGMMVRAAEEGAKKVDTKQEGKREVVRWVLDAPARLKEMVGHGERREAEREWEIVGGVLDKWEGVNGVEAVRKKCLTIMEQAQG